MDVRYTGCDNGQANFGNCDDPRDVLTVRGVYEIEDKEVYSWYTRYKLLGCTGWFNSVCFDELGERKIVLSTTIYLDHGLDSELETVEDFEDHETFSQGTNTGDCYQDSVVKYFQKRIKESLDKCEFGDVSIAEAFNWILEDNNEM